MSSVVPFVLARNLAPSNIDQALVQRPHLLQRLDELTHHKVCALIAPTGSGKTVLLSQYVHARASTRQMAWLRLDEPDIDPVHFFRQLSESVRRRNPEFCGYIALQHHGDETLQAEFALDAFIAGLNRLEQPLHLIIDNFEFLEHARWKPLLQQLIELSPDGVKWIVSGRHASSIDTYRWQLTELLGQLPQPQLFFSQQETADFLRAATAEVLADEAVQRIFQYTRGWPAGVKLSQVYLSRSAPQTDLASEHFGKHIFVSLCAAVLEKLPVPLRQFLVCTSFLEHFNADLCDHLLQTQHSNAHIHSLGEMALFLEAGGQDTSYRYHALLREQLLEHFNRQPVEQRNRLIARACTWLVEHQDREQACRLARRHGDSSFFGELLQQSMRVWLRSGHAEPVHYWVQQLGEPVPQAMPDTRFAACWALTMFGQLVAAETRITRTLLPSPNGDDDWKQLLQLAETTQDAGFAILHAIIRLFRGELGQAQLEGLQRLHKATFITQDQRASIDNILAQHAIHHCHFREARQHTDQALSILRQTRNLFGQSLASYLTADSFFQNNDIRSATLTCEDFLDRTSARDHFSAQALVAGFHAYLQYQGDKPLRAEQHIQDLLIQCQPGYSIDLQLYLYVPLLRMKTRRGHFLEAHGMLEQLHASAQACGSATFLAHIAFERVRLAYAKGNDAELQHWTTYFAIEEKCRSALDANCTMSWECREHWILAQIIVLMQQEQFDRARAMTQQLQYLNVDHGYPIRFLPINMCIAYLDLCTGQISTAYRRLNDTLTQAEATGMLTGLFDDLPGMDDMMRLALSHQRILSEAHVRKFRSLGILDICAGPTRCGSEALSADELTVKAGLERGLAPTELAEHLNLATRTVQWHLKNICYKLDVARPADILPRLRQLDQQPQ